MYTPKSEPQCQLQTGGDYAINVSRQLQQMHPSDGEADNGEAVHVWGLGAHGKALYLPLNFAVNLKLI